MWRIFNNNHIMRRIYLPLLSFLIFSCKSKQRNHGQTIGNIKQSIDSCLLTLSIDTNSKESQSFANFWTEVKMTGYSSAKDSTSPFVKIIFRPSSSNFYVDTLKLIDCSVFDNVNIHRINIQNSDSSNKKNYVDLIVEEWEFKDLMAAIIFVRYYGEYLKNDYPNKNPINVIQKNNSAFLFQTSSDKFIPEMERVERFVDKELIKYGQNY